MLGINILKRFGGGAPTGGGGGGGSSGVALSDNSIIDTRWARYKIGADGYTYGQISSVGFLQLDPWIFPQTGMNQFEVEATVTDGDTPPGTFGSWLDLATDHQWGWAGVVVEHTTQMLLEIRRKSDSVVVDSAIISLYASGTT